MQNNNQQKTIETKKALLFIVLITLVIIGIVASVYFSSYKPAPKVSEVFKEQLRQFIYEGTKAVTSLDVGTNYPDFSKQLVNVQTSYNIVLENWPKNLSNESGVGNFLDAFTAWEWALELWRKKIEDYEPPMKLSDGTSVGNFDVLMEYASSDLVILNKQDKLFSLYCSRHNEKVITCLPLSSNIQALLAKGSKSFSEGKSKILPIVQ